MMTPRQKVHREIYEKQLTSIEFYEDALQTSDELQSDETLRLIFIKNLDRAKKSAALHLEASTAEIYNGELGYFKKGKVHQSLIDKFCKPEVSFSEESECGNLIKGMDETNRKIIKLPHSQLNLK